MKISPNHSFFTIVLMLLAAAPLVGQKASNKVDKNENKKLEISANLMVLDEKNVLIEDIRIEDVKIFEDEVEQKPTFFVKKQPGLNLALVIDNTGSVKNQLKTIMKLAATIAVNLTKEDKAAVIRFVSRDKITIDQDWTNDTKALLETIENLYIEGGQSAVLDAVYLAAEELREREKSARAKRNAIVLITDGDDRDSYYSLKQVLAKFADSEMQVFSIGLTKDVESTSNAPLSADRKGNAEKLLNILSFNTNGRAFIFGRKYTEDEMLGALKSLMIELRSQYVIGYTPTNQKRGGPERKLRVEIAPGKDGQKRIGYIRDSFIVTKN